MDLVDRKKKLVFLKITLAFFIFGQPISFADTAKQVLNLLRDASGGAALINVTDVRGHSGRDQPEVWEIVTRIKDGERVFVFRSGNIVADTIYSSGGGVSVDLRRLKVDSVEAFDLAKQLAAKANVTFDSIDYELRAEKFSNAPEWVIHLRDIKGKDVARIQLSGKNQNTVKVDWFRPHREGRQQLLTETESFSPAIKQKIIPQHDGRVRSYDPIRNIYNKKKSIYRVRSVNRYRMPRTRKQIKK